MNMSIMLGTPGLMNEPFKESLNGFIETVPENSPRSTRWGAVVRT